MSEPREQVVITRAGNLIGVCPTCEEILKHELTYLHRSFRQVMGETFIDKEWMRLYNIDDKQRLVAPAGLLTRITRLFRDRNIEYRIDDLRSRRIPEPVITNIDVDGLRPGQAETMAAIFTHDMGQIDGATGFGKTWIITQVCRAYPTCNIIICAQQSNVVNSIVDKLSKICPGEVGQIGGGRKIRQDARIIVSTARSLEKAPMERCDIFLYDEVHTAAAPCTSSAIARIRYARMFGFSATTDGRFDGAELRTEALFGPVIVRTTYQDCVEAKTVAPIKVLMIPVPGLDLTTTTRSQVTKKRLCYWQNDARNQIIAAVAHMFPPEMQVLIMADAVEHIYRIGHYLQEYTLVYNTLQPKVERRLRAEGLLRKHPPMTHDRLQMYRRLFEKQKLKKVISSSIWGTGVDFTGLQVLIRADGAGGKIPSTQVPGRLSRLHDGKEYGILVDFTDAFDSWSLRRARSRARIYKSHGWDIHLVESSGGIERWLK